MKFVLDDDQRDFAASLDSLLAAVRHRRRRPRLGRRRQRARARAVEPAGRAGRHARSPPTRRRSSSSSPSRRSGGTPCPARGSSPRRTSRSPSATRSTGVATARAPAARALRARRRRRRRRSTSAARAATEVGELVGSVDRTRRLFARRAGERPRVDRGGLRPRRARHVRPAARRGRADPRRLGDLREAAQAVRPRDRLLPGDQARAGRRAHRPRLRPPARPRRRARRGAGVGRQGRVRRRGLPRLPHRPPGARRDRLHRRSSTSASGSPRSARWSPRGAPRPTTAPACWRSWSADGVRTLRGAAGAGRHRPVAARPSAADAARRRRTTRRCGSTLCEQIGVAALGIPEEYGGAGLLALRVAGRAGGGRPLPRSRLRC